MGRQDEDDAGKAAGTGGVRRQDGPEPYDGDRGRTGDTGVRTDDAETPKGGYDERRPGRGDYPGRGKGDSTAPQRAQEDELDARSRWRDADRDERSDRWKDDPGDDAPGA